MLDRRPDQFQQPVGRFPDGRRTAIGLEIVLPETPVLHALHSRQLVRLGQQLDRLAEMVARLAKQHGPDPAVEVLGRRRRGVPGTFGAPGVAVPAVALQRLAVILPVGVQHPDCAVLDAVADEVADVHRRHAEVRQNPAPIADPRADEELVARILERQDLVLEALPRTVAPREHHGVFGNLVQLVGVLQDNVAPHHHPLAVLRLAANRGRGGCAARTRRPGRSAGPALWTALRPAPTSRRNRR